MRRASLIRRLAAAATGLWLVASSSVSPLLACEAHGGMRGHAHAAAAAPGAHDGGSPDHGPPSAVDAPAHHAAPAHGAHAGAEHGHAGHHAAAPLAADAGSPAHGHGDDEGAPCTCAGGCCPSALVAVPGLTVAVAHATLVEVAVSATMRPAPVVAQTAPQRRQPPATPPPIRTLR